jgi:hypothetical protein
MTVKVKIFTISILLAMSLSVNAQTQFKVIDKLYSSLSDSLTNQIITSLNNLLISIDSEKLDTTLVDRKNEDFNRHFFTYLKGIERKDTIPKYFQGQLINLYPIENKQYLLTLAYTKGNEIGRILTFLAKEDNGKFVFASPIQYNTKYWKTAITGTITYFFRDTIDTKRTEIFNQKNILMAKKLGLPVRNWEVYMCQNYQEAIQIQGCLYEYTRSGYVNLGDVVSPKTLFSVMNDEDFSHDVFHGYASEIRGKVLNRSAEEGIAYLWGNAYYVGILGKAPEQKDLVPLLQQYVKAHKDVGLLDLFEKNPDIFAGYGYPRPRSVKSTISGIICGEIERQKGTDGVIELIRCGRGDDNFFKSIENLVGINRENFDTEVYKLIFNQ